MTISHSGHLTIQLRGKHFSVRHMKARKSSTRIFDGLFYMLDFNCRHKVFVIICDTLLFFYSIVSVNACKIYI